MPMPKRMFAPEEIAEAKRLYEQTLTPMEDIAGLLRISRATLQKRVREWNWVKPKYAPRARALAKLPQRAAEAPEPKPMAPPLPASPLVPSGAIDRAALAARVQAAIEREIHMVDSILSTLGPPSADEAERAARTLASLARTLREVMRLDAPPAPPEPTDDTPLPRDVNELRRALSRKLDYIIAQRTAAISGDP